MNKRFQHYLFDLFRRRDLFNEQVQEGDLFGRF